MRDLWEMAAVLDFFNLFRYRGEGAGGGAQDLCGQGSGKSGRQLNVLDFGVLWVSLGDGVLGGAERV